MHHESARFTGTEAWEGPATWGQQGFRDGLRRYAEDGWYGNAVPSWPVPDGTELADVLAAIGAAVSRHEGLRTILTDGPDGLLRQRLLADGEFPVEIVPAGDRPDADVAQVVDRLRATPLSLTGGLPFGAAVVTRDNRPYRVVAAISHLAVDASAVRVLLGAVESGPAPLQPRELALKEADPVTRRRGERAVAYWRAEAARAALPFAVPRPGTDHGAYQLALTSAPAAARLENLAQKTELNSSALLLGAVAVALGAAVGERDLFLQLVTSNRHLPRMADYVGVLAQLGPLVTDLDPDQPFTALARRVQEQSLKTYRSAYWSPADLDVGLRADGRSADGVLGATFTFNDARGPWPRVPDVAPDPGRDFALRPLAGWPYQGGRCAVTAAGQPGESLTLSVRLDTAYVDRALGEPLLLAMETVLRRAHDDGPEVSVGALTDAAATVLAPTV
ncbi:condensation domain-containing protein [Micromonospora sp. CPCC 206060]|uniref:condensation domain-containing protein n=1 Tax=Micromonospora sp. CPCC 206060 TaxID=3122406 RepID=UPI002FF42F4E